MCGQSQTERSVKFEESVVGDTEIFFFLFCCSSSGTVCVLNTTGTQTPPPPPPPPPPTHCCCRRSILLHVSPHRPPPPPPPPPPPLLLLLLNVSLQHVSIDASDFSPHYLLPKENKNPLYVCASSLLPGTFSGCGHTLHPHEAAVTRLQHAERKQSQQQQSVPSCLAAECGL
ncbi:unnamed protein product [Pleuronectes platessa]|uniref:Uncharacterized protein n=1 Tax=Pleuronectes platessa TaxID=8262 RepID=A0A9N7YCQ8_PLEPL|nr:unnamed protein product [Pleuronectes platessa]